MGQTQTKPKTILIHATEIGDTKTIQALCNDFNMDVSKLDRKKYTEQLIKDDLNIKKSILSASERLNFGILGENLEQEYRNKYKLSEYITREAIDDDNNTVSAAVIATLKNDYTSLDIILSGLKKLKSQKALSEFLDKTQVNTNYTLLIMALLSYDDERVEDNIKTINILLQYGANPKESVLTIDDKKVDVIQMATKTQNIEALKYFKAMYLKLSQSQSFIVPKLLEQRAGDKAEISSYVYQARELANTTSSNEIIEVLDDWIEIIDAKSSKTQNLLNKTSTHQIYNDEDILSGGFKIEYSVDKSNGRICNINVSQPYPNTSTTKKIKAGVDINHFYSTNKRATYNSNRITEAFITISWTATKLDGEIFGSSGVIKIDSKDILNPEVTVVQSSRGRLE